MVAVVAMAAMAAAVLAGAACSGSGSGSSGPKFSETECSDCIGVACSAEISSCAALGDCADALECALDCPAEDNALDTDCVESRCTDLITTANGGSALDAVIGCYLVESPTGGSCEAQCAPSTE